MPLMQLDGQGRLVCPSNPSLVTWGHPWPSPNGTQGFAEPAWGYVIHTEVGYEHSVEQEFENPRAQASAFVSIGMDGHVHQYGPIGKGWKAWTQVNGNTHYRGVEHEDHGNPHNPLTAAQIESSASVLECISRHDGFPLAATDNPNGGRGVIFHSDGRAAWGGHDCPGSTRRAQRPAIINRASAIRGGKPKPPAPNPTPKPTTSVVALQQACHVTADGHWGPATDAALSQIRRHTHTRAEQAAVGVVTDGVWGPKSKQAEQVAIHRIQTALRVTSDGQWGPTTDAAFLAARKRYFTTSAVKGRLLHVRQRLFGA